MCSPRDIRPGGYAYSPCAVEDASNEYIRKAISPYRKRRRKTRHKRILQARVRDQQSACEYNAPNWSISGAKEQDDTTVCEEDHGGLAQAKAECHV